MKFHTVSPKPELIVNLHPKKPVSKRPRSILLMVLILLLGLILFLGYSYYQARQKLLTVFNTSQEEQALAEVNQVLDSMKKLTLIPNEVPVIATITDSEFLLKESAFYEGSIDGDKLVLFKEARRAYIYSPSRQILVNAGPLLLEDNGQASVVTASDSASVASDAKQDTSTPSTDPISIEVRNGSTTIGEAGRLRDDLQAKGYTVTAIGNAARSDYSQIQIFDLTDNQDNPEVTQLITELGATLLPDLPADETAVSADILIIIGNP